MSSTSSSPASLQRVVGLWGAVWMGLGSILGTGVFVSLGIAAGIAGSTLWVAVLLAALVATCNGLSSAQLAAAHPVSGGTYAYGYRFLHPSLGYTAGWMYLSAKSASAATAALGCAGYLLHSAGFSGRWSRVGLACTIVLVLTGLVASGVRRSNRANMLIVSCTLLVLCLFIVGGVLSFTSETWTKLAPQWPGRTLTWPALGEAVALMFVAYTGYGRIATLGEEVREPARTIPRAIIATLGVSAFLYVGVALAAIGSAGAGVFAKTTQHSAAPLEAVARGFTLPSISWFVTLGAITAMLGVLLNLILGLSRILFAMARQGDAPQKLSTVNTTKNSPTYAVLTMGLVVMLLALFGDVKTTWSFSAFTVLIYYGITNLAALKLPPEHQRFPRIISWMGLLACFGLAWFVETRAWVLGLVLLAIGWLLRIFWQRMQA